jgi:hypothetical protein
MAHYRRLSLMEREELSRMLAAGASLRAARDRERCQEPFPGAWQSGPFRTSPPLTALI